jgi:hypothetical protein
MTLVQLRYFVAAATKRSMTEASLDLHVAQSAVSTAIAQLERGLGVQLFVRQRSRGLALTDAGEQLLLDILSAKADELRGKKQQLDNAIIVLEATLKALECYDEPVIDQPMSSMAQRQGAILGGFFQREFKPEYLQAGSQANLNFTALRDKYLSGKLKPGPQELAKLNDYAKWRSTAWEELNSYIKDLAGSAVTGNELERTLNARPNPGTGWFDGDSPQQYAAKMDATLRNGKAAIARFRYLREKGLLNAGETMAKREDLGAQFPLEKMGNIIDQEGAAVLERLKRENPGVPDQQLLPRAMDEVSKRFGLAI